MIGDNLTAPASISFLKNRLEKITRSEKNINRIKNRKFEESFFIVLPSFFCRLLV